jgi:class 3 adenylate cyclase
MIRAGRVIGTSQLKGKVLSDEDLVLAAWPAAVGKRLAGRCRPISLIRNRLVIEVEDQVWRSQLMALHRQILDRLEQVMGNRTATELEFRIGVPRREPARELGRRATDDADAIGDPIMRRLYKAARKRAGA